MQRTCMILGCLIHQHVAYIGYLIIQPHYDHSHFLPEIDLFHRRGTAADSPSSIFTLSDFDVFDVT